MAKQRRPPKRPAPVIDEGSALRRLAERLTLEPLPMPPVRLKEVYRPVPGIPDEPDAVLPFELPAGTLLGFPPGTPAAIRKLAINVAAILISLEEGGWRPPGAHVAAGKASGSARRAVQAVRRKLIEHSILPQLTQQQRNHLRSVSTIEAVHRLLQELGSAPDAENSPVLRSCRTVSERTIAEDLAQISRARP
jgi:hypothetical protein